MLMLSPEQTERLAALVRERDLVRLGDSLALAFPDVPARLGDRYAALIALAAQRGAAHGLTHLLCLARYLACWVAFGAEFESRPGFEWAAAILAAAERGQGARVFQLCRRATEQLAAQPQAGRPAADVFAAALAVLDTTLRSAGDLAELGPRQAIQIGQACDLSAVDLRLVGSGWRQHYLVQDGQWRRVPCAPAVDAVTLRDGDTGGDAPAALPPQITLLSQPLGGPGAAGVAGGGGEGPARLRLRTHAAACCDPLLHPLVSLTTDHGLRQLRGPLAADVTWALPVTTPPPDGIAAEGSPTLHPLALASCGLRDSGVAVAALDTLLAVYPAAQHLLVWQRQAPAASHLPDAAAANAPAPVRVRLERDGQPAPGTRWQAGLQALDTQLAAGLARLLAAWERDSGTTAAGLAADSAVLCGQAGLSWGWAERAEGIAVAPFMRVVGWFDQLVCKLQLTLRGRLAWDGSSSDLQLHCDLQGALPASWQRSAADADLGAALQPLQLSLRAPFTLALMPLADAALCTLTIAAPASGALVLQAGLRPRLDAGGLEWYAHIATEPVRAGLVLHDPLLGQTTFSRPLLPALTLLDWTLR